MKQNPTRRIILIPIAIGVDGLCFTCLNWLKRNKFTPIAMLGQQPEIGKWNKETFQKLASEAVTNHYFTPNEPELR